MWSNRLIDVEQGGKKRTIAATWRERARKKRERGCEGRAKGSDGVAVGVGEKGSREGKSGAYFGPAKSSASGKEKKWQKS